jgi:hypothetical protein
MVIVAGEFTYPAARTFHGINLQCHREAPLFFIYAGAQNFEPLRDI